MRSSHIIPILAAVAAFACVDAQSDPSALPEDPNAGGAASVRPAPPLADVVAALESAPSEGLWPRFSPAAVPVALYDGERTVLIGHPAPPDEFVPSADIPGAFVAPGRHAAVRGNMPTTIGGVPTAAVLVERMGGMSPARAAAVVTHERFHIHQGQRHANWGANELAVFQHPSTDVQQLFDRRLETLGLHRALQAANTEQTDCWLRTALLLRRKRMAQLPPAVAQYERAIERTEGLARYIERRAAGLGSVPSIDANGYAPDDVRERAYATGEALAVMLDRYAQGWRERVENSEEPPVLDSLLWLALEQRPETSCGFSAGERSDVHEQAKAAVETILADRDSVVRAFITEPGWSVRVIAEGGPLWPQSFDPMRVRRVGSAALLHERMLRAGNENGYIDVFDRRALSIGYLDDPLGSGISEVRVTGFDERPAFTSGEEIRVRMAAPGLELTFQNAQVVTADQEIVVRVH
ncbi:MAG TPA: hypothetical protein VF039_05920 [Longimicrobiales bacterium]